MTIQPAPMPHVPAALHGAPVDHAPILETLADQVADILRPEVDGLEVSIGLDYSNVYARVQGCGAAVAEFRFDERGVVLATVTCSEDERVDEFNAPDRSIARDILARLRGGR